MPAISKEWKDDVIAKIDNIADCEDLQIYAEKIVANLKEQLIKAAESLGILEPLKVDLDIPTDLPSVIEVVTDIVEWIKKIVATYILGPIAKVTEFMIEMAEFQARVMAAITSKIGDLQCTFTPPTP